MDRRWIGDAGGASQAYTGEELSGAAEALCSSIRSGVLVTDPSGHHIYANAPMVSLLRSGQPHGNLAPPAYIPHDQHRRFWQAIVGIEHATDVDAGDTSIELVRGSGDRILAAFNVLPWSVGGRLCAVWILIEAYEYDPRDPVEAQWKSTATTLDVERWNREDAIAETWGVTAVRSLTPREHEVILRLLGGSRVDAIARRLKISSNTVRNHLKSIFRKLNVHSQQEAIDRYRQISMTPVSLSAIQEHRQGHRTSRGA